MHALGLLENDPGFPKSPLLQIARSLWGKMRWVDIVLSSFLISLFNFIPNINRAVWGWWGDWEKEKELILGPSPSSQSSAPPPECGYPLSYFSALTSHFPSFATIQAELQVCGENGRLLQM